MTDSGSGREPRRRSHASTSPAASALGDVVESDRNATIGIVATDVHTVAVDHLWTDWGFVDANTDGGDGSNPSLIETAGRFEISWDDTQPSVSPALTVSLPDRYVGGTYIVGVAAVGPQTTARTDAMVAVDPGTESFQVETVTTGVDYPWGLEFLPDGTLVATERDAGRVVLVDRNDGTVTSVDGTPTVFNGGQGGLLDVARHPDYEQTPWLYLTYAVENADGDTATALGRGSLDREVPAFETFEQLHVAEPFVDSNGHFGSRVVFGDGGTLYVTTGDRQFKNFGPDHVSQDPSNELGATLRLQPDGSVPPDNPFVDDPGVVDSIYSYGHRNPQGMTVRPETGALWQSEHGERDGDEINVVEAGKNYGWPVATYACEYGTTDPIGDDPHERDDLARPVYYWRCGTGGFPPAGATFYDGDAFPDWRGDLFVGNLAGSHLGRFVVSGRQVAEADPLLDNRGWRVRDVAVAPDSGALYVAVDESGGPIARLVP